MSTKKSDNLWILAIFQNRTIELAEWLANKRKGPHFVEGYNTWCRWRELILNLN